MYNNYTYLPVEFAVIFKVMLDKESDKSQMKISIKATTEIVVWCSLGNDMC